MSEDTPEYCGVGIRGVALTIDAFVWFLLFFVAVMPIAFVTGNIVVTDAGVQADLTGPPATVATLLWFSLALGYHTVTEYEYGQTAGKNLVKIEVASVDGSPVTLRAAAIRNVARLVDFLPVFYLVGIVLAARSDRHQRLGDRLADTVVVRS